MVETAAEARASNTMGFNTNNKVVTAIKQYI